MNTAEPFTIAINNCDGEPRNPRSWSGTTSNIFYAMETLGVRVIGINSQINRYQAPLYKLIHRLSGLGTDYMGGAIFRHKSGSIAQRQIRKYGCTKVLHMGQLGLPIPNIDPTVDHYLVCDTTRNLWNKVETSLLSRCTPKMMHIAEKLEWQSFAQIKHFFPFSNYVRDDLINYYKINPNRITVIGSGRGRLKPFTGDKDYKNGHILFVARGRFEDKGGLILLEGFKLAQQKNPSLKLVIVGQDEYLHLNGSIPNVTVKGYVSWGEELQNLFDTSALFAMPSLNEPWGLVYLEALACKTPILGLNRNALPQMTQQGKYGFLVDEPTPEMIAQVILQAFSNPQKLKEMGEAGQKYCLETFTWKQAAKKMINIMRTNEK
ncbi:glycosyltransferase family 4 protein [Aetokthonos hydrillicola]|uniref:glycosyltransferase family 4 protein n=1 Tax=Aetokthonos hydrillicola TaxID=1550245 RepID=UPI001ABB81CB